VTNAAPKYRVLVVDDEEAVLTTYRMILERHGYEVVACPSSRDALNVLATNAFDSVLCDYSLEEDHTGLEVILAARERDADVPAALLTGYATPEATEEAASHNINIMFKPVDIEEFLNTTSKMVRRES
jgi:two-component system phosphoglycerate transport system response regulator PgtA